MGIVGAGAAGLLHALSHRAHGVRVALVFDPNASQARALAELCGGDIAPDVSTIARSDVDCVSICSPPASHVEQALACAREGRMLLVEKPVAVARDDLERIARAPGCVPIVQWRWGRAIRAVRRAIALGVMGSAPTVSVDLAWRRDAAYFRKRVGWGCGALLSVGIHAVDAVCFALDRALVDVSGALAASARSEGEGEASAVLHATFRGGAALALRVTFEGGVDETRLSFCGGGVTAVITGSEADPTASSVAWRCEDGALLQRLTELERSTDGSVHGPLIVPYMGRAIEAWRRGGVPGQGSDLASIGDVVPAHDLVMRVYESASSRSTSQRALAIT